MSAPILRAVASPRRREILRLLCERERSAGELRREMPDVTFGAVSLQLKVLLDAGLVTRHAEGTSRIYRVQRRNLGPVGTMLQTMWSDALHRLKLQAELQETRRGPAPGTRRATCTSRVKTLSRRTRRTHKRELP